MSISGCALNQANQPPVSAAVQAQTITLQSVQVAGIALQTAPGVIDSLYTLGKISKDNYNKVVPVYNRALGSYLLLEKTVEALQVNNDLTSSQSYVAALNVFLSDQDLLKNLLLSFGVDTSTVIAVPTVTK